MSWQIIILRPSEGEKTDSDQTWQCWLLSRPQAKTHQTSYVPGPDDSCPLVQIHSWNWWDIKDKIYISSTSSCTFTPFTIIITTPAQFSPREHLVSPNPEDHTAPKQQTIIRPQDIEKQLTPRLTALTQETSPLTPYKIQCSAKRRARQMLSNMR